MKTLRTIFLAGLMLCAAPLTALAKPPLDKTPVDAAPKTIAEATKGPSGVTVWKTGDADTTIYLMGTVHILNPEVVWQNNAYETAWNAAGTVYFEADVLSPETTNAMAALIPALGFNPPGVTFSSFFTQAQQAELSDALAVYGVTLAQLAPLRPWLAGIQISNMSVAKAGGKPEFGLEMILGARVIEEAKTVRYLETVVEQLEILASSSDEDQAAIFYEGIDDLYNPEVFFAKLVGAWYHGDDQALADIMTTGLDVAPNVAEALLYERNKAWADTFDTLIKEEKGVFFVAVGAGHLVGEKSVQDYLARLGHKTTRTN